MCSAVVYVAMLEAHLGVRVRRPLTHSEGLVSSQLGLGAGSGERSELLREHHVALDLHLARHEGLHALQSLPVASATWLGLGLGT